MPESRPLLLLDVDGVLNAFGAWTLIHEEAGLRRDNVRAPEGWRSARVDGYHLLLNPEHAEWVATLSTRFDMVWATMWQDRAPAALAHAVGFGADWPFIDFQRHQGYRTTQRTGLGIGGYKFPGVVATVGDRPMVWIDDDLEPAIYEWVPSGTPVASPPCSCSHPRPRAGRAPSSTPCGPSLTRCPPDGPARAPK